MPREKIFVLFFLIAAFLPLLSYSDDAFDDIASAIRNQVSQIHLQQLQKRYKNKRIGGKGYLISVTKNIEGDIIANLSTEKDSTSLTSVNVVVFLRECFSEKALKLKPGRYVRFFGNFDEIRMKTIIVRKGIVK